MTQPPPWLTGILEEHFEELEMLWGTRSDALRDPEYDENDLRELDQRIEAHVDGLVLGGNHSVPILAAAVGGDEQAVVASALYVLLKCNLPEAADVVVAAIRQAGEDQIDGLVEGLRFSDLSAIADKLHDHYNDGPAPAAAVSAEAFASHSLVARSPSRLAEFYASEDPGVRRAAWRITALLELE